jgi:hypothetical protein
MKSLEDLQRDRAEYLGEETAEDELMTSERIRGYWSAGAEIYYSATEKLGGCKFFLGFTEIISLSTGSVSISVFIFSHLSYTLCASVNGTEIQDLASIGPRDDNSIK